MLLETVESADDMEVSTTCRIKDFCLFVVRFRKNSRQIKVISSS